MNTYSLLKHIRIGRKRKQLIYLFFITVPILFFIWKTMNHQVIDNPSQEDLIGTYIMIQADNGIPKSDYHKYVLELNADSSFNLTPTPGISLCSSGHYELDYNFEYNELSFQCGLGWTPKHIKRLVNGFEIVFYLNFDSGKNISFKKIKN